VFAGNDRILVKEIIKSEADLIPDRSNKKLNVRLHTLSTPLAGSAAGEPCTIFNKTETHVPGADFRMVYKTAHS
jgi:hypothetical protein